jgi:hypothetical protein
MLKFARRSRQRISMEKAARAVMEGYGFRFVPPVERTTDA